MTRELLMKKQKLNFTRGETIIFTQGEYSSYSFEGPFIALKDFNIKEALIELEAWATEQCKDRMHFADEMRKLGFLNHYSFPNGEQVRDEIDPGHVTSILLRYGYVDIDPHRSFHLGEYGKTTF